MLHCATHLLPFRFPTATLLSSHIYGTENRIRVPEPSPLRSYKVAPSVAMWCSTNVNQWGPDGKLVGSHLHSQWVSHLLETNQVFGAGDGARDRRSWKVEMAWPSLHFAHLPETLPHWPVSSTVTQSFDNKRQDAAGPYPTLVSQDLLLHTARSPAWPCDHGAMALVQQLFDFAAAPRVHSLPGQVSFASFAKVVCELRRSCNTCSRASSRDVAFYLVFAQWVLMWQKLTEAKVRSS